jgi:hypothetical protein
MRHRSPARPLRRRRNQPVSRWWCGDVRRWECRRVPRHDYLLLILNRIRIHHLHRLRLHIPRRVQRRRLDVSPCCRSRILWIGYRRHYCSLWIAWGEGGVCWRAGDEGWECSHFPHFDGFEGLRLRGSFILV